MKLSPILIGLGGALRAGKDAVADRLVEAHGFVKIGMSDALHEAMLAIDPIVGLEPLYGDFEYERYSEMVGRLGYVEAKKNGEVRRLLQKLGTEVGRDMIGENVWVNIIARKIDDHRGAGHPVVVTGIRFPNEVQMIRELAGEAVWITRPGLDAGAAGAHASETSVDQDSFDRIIVNDGTLEDLNGKVDSYLAAFHNLGQP